MKCDAATVLVERAKKLAKECDYSLEEALGDVIGAVIFEVDAVLYKDGDVLPTAKDSLFYKRVMFQVEHFFDKTKRRLRPSSQIFDREKKATKVTTVPNDEITEGQQIVDLLLKTIDLQKKINAVRKKINAVRKKRE